ncbi:alpha/beta hydrolase [Spongisporangium articulatum]|uniref:Alpha/beta hydrolase n=1 Tax=Spongisporangium articulatum TaxID=3362603 RepID=A0ABW8AHV1_9ACTN
MKLGRGAVAGVLVALLALLAGTAVVAGPAQAATGVGTRAADGAEVVSERWSWDLRELTIEIRSPAVGRTLPVKLIMPVGWSFESSRRWPVMMMLQGGGHDDYTTWGAKTDVDALAKKWQVITVFPEAGDNATYTNYFNGGRFGKPAWEDFHTQEVLQILQKTYRANTNRAVAGLSSGGYGSMIYAARNPGMFKYASSYSGLVTIRLPIIRWAAFFASRDADPSRRFGVPFVNERNWELHDPLYMAGNLRGTGIYLSSGYTGIPAEDDTVAWSPQQFAEPIAATLSIALEKKLNALNIPVTVHYYPRGEHQWPSWQRELHRSWPLMMQAIGAGPNP